MSLPQLSMDHVLTLLDKLENDDGYRALFASDAGAALEQIGAPVRAAICFRVQTLASKQSFRDCRDALISQLAGEAQFRPHLLEAAAGATLKTIFAVRPDQRAA
jgi:putative modified peptide